MIEIDVLPKIARKKNDISDATKIILPGVGAFDYAMDLLTNSGMRDEIEKKVLKIYYF